MRSILSVVAWLLCFGTIAFSQNHVTLREETVVSLYRGTSKVGEYPSWDGCKARAQELARANTTQTSGSVTYSCKTEVRKVIAAYSPVSTTPVNCVVSAWTCSTPVWGSCVNGTQSGTQNCTRTVVTPASNGGTACPALSETRTVSQPCSITPVPGNLLFQSGWRSSVLGCSYEAFIDSGDSRWGDYGPSSATNAPNCGIAAIDGTVFADGGAALRVTQLPGNINGTDFRIVKAFGNQPELTATWKVRYAENYRWASADHKMGIFMDAAQTAQNVYYNLRGGSDPLHARLAIHVIPSDTVFTDRSFELTVGRWYRVRGHIITGSAGRVEAWITDCGTDGSDASCALAQERKLTLVHEAGQAADPNRLNVGQIGAFKLDTIYNIGSNIPAGGFNQWFDSIRVYAGLWP